MSLRNLVTSIQKLVSGSSTDFRFGVLPDREHEPREMVADTTEFIELTGWCPTVSLQEGLQRMVNHYRDRVAS